MRFISLVLILVLVGVGVQAGEAATSDSQKSAQKKAVSSTQSSLQGAGKISIEVPGMVCQMCVQGMRKAFKDVVAVPDKDINVDLDKKLVHLNLKSSLTDDEIKKRIRSTGYKAKKIAR